MQEIECSKRGIAESWLKCVLLCLSSSLQLQLGSLLIHLSLSIYFFVEHESGEKYIVIRLQNHVVRFKLRHAIYRCTTHLFQALKFITEGI